jgi:hypothetical protein
LSIKFSSSSFAENLHLAVQREYPMAEQLPMPPNIDAAETTRFSPLRNRDITSSTITLHHESIGGIDVTLAEMKAEPKSESNGHEYPHLESYDCQTAVNLCSVMQSTVPEPFGGNHNYANPINMPGGSWGQQTKYLSHELNSSHYTQLRQDVRSDWYKGINKSTLNCSLLNNNCLFDRHHHPFLIINKRFISLSCKNANEQAQKASGESPPEKETGRSKLKTAVKEYGSTVIVFHIGISLVSLGIFYALVSRFVRKFFLLFHFLINNSTIKKESQIKF